MSIHPRTTDRGRVYDVRYRGPGGQNFSRTFLTKRAALEFEAQQRTAKNRGTWIDPRGSKITMRELGQEWLDSNPAKRDSTWTRDESALRITSTPSWGTGPLAVSPRSTSGGWSPTGPRISHHGPCDASTERCEPR